MEKVSVIIPAYNAEQFIRDAIESALRQTYPNIEIIVVDDGSTDGTAGILNEYASTGRLIYYYQENAGSASARNKGLENATGEYIAFLDSDDLWQENYIDRQLSCFDKNPDAGMVFCNEYSITMAGELVKTPPKLKDGEEPGVIFDKLLSECFTTPSTVVIKREVTETIGFFNTKIIYNEDWEFLIRAAMRFGMAYQPEYIVTRRHHPDSKTSRHYYVAYDFLDVYISVRKGLDNKRARLFRAQNVRRCWKSSAWLIDRKQFKDGIKLFVQVVRRYPPFVLKLPALLRRGLGALIKVN